MVRWVLAASVGSRGLLFLIRTIQTMADSPKVVVRDVFQHAVDQSKLWGARVSNPLIGEVRDGYSLGIEGWVVSRGSRAVAIECICGGVLVRRVHVNLVRPDIQTLFPQAADALKSGFRMSLSALNFPTLASIYLQIVLEDGELLPLSVITLERATIAPTNPPVLTPILLSTLGRTGSTWAMRLLGEHPQLVAYRPFEYEPRFTHYWLDVFATLAEPRSYYQAIEAELYDETWWVGRGRSVEPPDPEEPQLRRWFGSDSVIAAADFCLSRIDSFYREVRGLQSKASAQYFVEKCWPSQQLTMLMSELYPGGKEIVLVRDFRDMVCSILSFNRSRGFASFGRELVATDEDFVRKLRESATQLLDHWKRQSARAHLLRYEDLILQPQATLQAMFEYLEVEATPELIERVLKQAKGLTLEAQKEHSTSKDASSSVGRWRKDLSDDLKRICRESFGDVLDEFGYER